MGIELNFQKTNERLLEIALREGLKVGAFEIVDDIEPKRIMLLFELVLTPYFSNKANKKLIKEFSERAKRVFSANFGMFSLCDEYSKLVDDLEKLLKKIK